MTYRRTRNVLRPALESMESRAVPSQFVVVTNVYGPAQTLTLPPATNVPPPKFVFPTSGGPSAGNHNPYAV